MTNRVFWLRPHQGTAEELASRVMAAGHGAVRVHAGLVGFVPIDGINEAAPWWVDSIQRHFDAELVPHVEGN